MAQHSSFSFRSLALNLGASLIALAALAPSAAMAQVDYIPGMSSGNIGNKTLQQNQDIINAQGVGSVSSFMQKGSQHCDRDGGNCLSLFGVDDSFDFTSSSAISSDVSGADGQTFGANGAGDIGASIASQVGSIVLRCGDPSVQIAAGIALKPISCSANAAGGATLTYQTCTAPMRGFAVTAPDNAVQCSSSPNSPSFNPPPGKVCAARTCDSEPLGSLDGWTSAKTITLDAARANDPAPSQEESGNGLGVSVYPSDGAALSSFTANSEGLTAVRIARVKYDDIPANQVLGINVAYRKVAEFTDQILEGNVNPGQQTAMWNTILKLGVNPEVRKQEETLSSTAAYCLEQLHAGMISANEVSVCNENFSNESGLKAIATTARVAAPDGSCEAVPQCIEEEDVTNTWPLERISDIPVGTMECITTTTHQEEVTFSFRERPYDSCTEKRKVTYPSCAIVYKKCNCKTITPEATESNPEPESYEVCDRCVASNSC